MIEIEVQAARRTSRGEVWRATLPDGKTIESRTPFFAAARSLLAAGVGSGHAASNAAPGIAHRGDALDRRRGSEVDGS